MKKNDEEDIQFKMRLGKPNEDVNEDVEEQTIPTEVNEMKLEKINQRVTLISILIPVLIVVVLVITYLDIKKRVVRTEDTGASEFQKLSSDLESRFSSLSVRQARIEDAMDKLIEENNKATVALQVRLDKVQTAVKDVNKLTAEQKESKAAMAEVVKQVNAVVESSNQAATQTAAITQELKKQIDQANHALTASASQLAAVEKKVSTIDQGKIDKQAMDLAIRFEILKLDNSLKTQIDALQSKLNNLESQSGRRTSISAPPSSPPSSQTAAPKPVSPASGANAPSTKPDTSSGSGIEEQTIAK
jgi:DNA repair exonuclease SbcCD ATPase subunit